MPLVLEIVTPEKKVYSETVEQVVLPTALGETGILPSHIPLITKIEAGELRVTREGQTEYLAVDKGFAEVIGDTVSVLTEAAIEETEIDLSKVEAAEQRAKEALEAAEKEGIDGDDLDALVEQFEATARFAIAQKLLKRRR